MVFMNSWMVDPYRLPCRSTFHQDVALFTHSRLPLLQFRLGGLRIFHVLEQINIKILYEIIN